MNFVDKISFAGKWNIITQAGPSPGSLSIEKTGETYKCAWGSGKQHPDYIGIGMLADHKLYVSRFRQPEAGKNAWPPGGVCVYKPIGDQRSLAALWAETDNFCSVGSGIAIRKETSERFEGCYEVRYFLNGQEAARFDLQIAKAVNKDFYNLSWAREEKLILHGIGMIACGQMVLAWGELATEWEVVLLSVEKQGDGCLLNSLRASRRDNAVCEEVFRRDISIID